MKSTSLWCQLSVQHMVVLCLAATYLIVTHSVGWVRGRDELVAPRSLRTSTKIFLDISDHFLSLSQPSQESTLILNRDKELIPVPQRATKNFYSSEIMNTRMRASRTGSFGPQKPPPTGIARLCDIAILKKDYTLFNKPLEEARTIFVLAAIQLDGIRALKALLDRMQPEHKKVVVVVACGDSTFPNSADARDRGFNAAQRQEMLQVIDHPMILSMFVENLDERVHPGRVHSLPLGLNPMEGPIVMKYYMDTLQSIIVETTATTAATATKANGTVVANGSSSGGADSLTSLSESTEPSAHIRRSPSRARAIQKGGVAHPHAHAHAHPIIGMISGSSSSSNNYDNNNSNSDSSVSSNSSSRGSGVDSPTQLDEFLREFFYSRPLKFTNYNREHRGEQFQERRIVHELAQRAPWKEFCTAHPKPSLLQGRNRESYLNTMAQSAFTLCVHGGGLDPNPKVWEAMLLGVIPIIKRSALTYIYEEEDLPVVVVDAWTPELINQQNLTRWKEQFAPYITDPEKRRATLEKLTLDYWWRKVTASLQQPED